MARMGKNMRIANPILLFITLALFGQGVDAAASKPELLPGIGLSEVVTVLAFILGLFYTVQTMKSTLKDLSRKIEDLEVDASQQRVTLGRLEERLEGLIKLSGK